MATAPLPLIILALTTLLLLLSFHTQAQTPTAPAPSPAGPVNLTGILQNNGQYTTLIRLLNTTQVGNQLENQLNNSQDGLTFFAPTDNAFNNLKPGALNGLSAQEQNQLLQYHILPKFYTLNNLLLVSNPVATQASGKDGVWGLNFTGQNNQVNVSTGVVETRINNALRSNMPLAVYEVDQVLLPEELFGVNPPEAAPAPPPKESSGGKSNTTRAADAPATPDGSSAGGREVALGLVLGLWLACIGVLS